MKDSNESMLTLVIWDGIHITPFTQNNLKRSLVNMPYRRIVSYHRATSDAARRPGTPRYVGPSISPSISHGRRNVFISSRYHDWASPPHLSREPESRREPLLVYICRRRPNAAPRTCELLNFPQSRCNNSYLRSVPIRLCYYFSWSSEHMFWYKIIPQDPDAQLNANKQYK